MTHEKIFKRDDGTKYQIRAKVIVDWRDRQPIWDISVWKCEPRKRTWLDVRYNLDSDYTWRRMSLEARRKFNITKYLEFVTEEEIDETLIELWNNLRPQKIATWV